MVATGRVVTGGGGGGSVAWTSVTGKPTTFPPSIHSHAVADVTGLQALLDGKAASSHSHAWADITGKPSTFPPDTHSHAYADITGKPSTFAPSAHTHAIADTTGLQAALDGAPRILVHNGTSYAVSSTADIYVGDVDPGSVPDGSVWIDTSA